MRTYISPLGFDSTRVTRPVLSHGLDAGDSIVLLRPSDGGDNGRGNQAVGDVRRMLTEVSPEVTITVEELPPDDFNTAVRRCLDILKAAKGEVVVNFGGGPRELFLPFAISTLVAQQEVDVAFLFSDINGSVRQIRLPDLMTPLTDPVVNTLVHIAEHDSTTSLPELDRHVDRSKSTLGRHLDQLEKAGAVRTEQRGKTRHVELTLDGDLRLAARG